MRVFYPTAKVRTALPGFLLLVVIIVGVDGSGFGKDNPVNSSPTVTTVDRAIDRYAESIGGRKAIGQIKTQVKKGLGIGNSVLEVYQAFPGRFCKISVSRHGTYRIAAGRTGGWTQDNKILRNAADDLIVYERTVDDPFFVLSLRKYFPKLSFRPAVREGDKEVYRVVGTLPPEWDPRLFGSELEVCFDARTGLVLSIGRFQFEDYRQVDGIRVPFTVRMLHSGEEEHVIRYDEIRHNQPVDEKLFDQPAPDRPLK